MFVIEALGEPQVASLGSMADLLIIPVVISLLIFKEVSTSLPSTRARMTARLLDIVLAPLMFVYASLVIARLLNGLT